MKPHRMLAFGASSMPSADPCSVGVIPPARLKATRSLNSALLVITTAILDRQLHHVHIDGRSDRLRELDQLVRTPTPAASDDPTPGGPPTYAEKRGA
jgi:hypothetical protein